MYNGSFVVCLFLIDSRSYLQSCDLFVDHIQADAHVYIANEDYIRQRISK